MTKTSATRDFIPTALTVFVVVAFTALIGMSSAVAEESAASPQNWCGTQEIFQAKVLAHPELYKEYIDGKSPNACPNWGECDVPNIRDQWIPEADQPLKEIPIIIHLLRNDNGSNAISSDSYALSQVDRLNADYAQARISFRPTIDHVDNTNWRYLSESEIDAMKSASAITPDSALNVWVTEVDFGYSFGTFPWDSDARTATGGIVLGDFHWLGGLNSVFAHEVGHCLGLYHTFTGVTEVSGCGSECYESPNEANADVVGDRCSDTPPAPLSYSCSNYPGNDPCSGDPWGYTMPENYMTYAPQWCYELFTPQQAGRMHCWIDDRLGSWVAGVKFVADTTFGPVPLDVTFDGQANKMVDEWQWDFGDGETAAVEDPVHTFDVPGNYSVQVTIQTDDGPYTDAKPDLVSVYGGDLMRADSVVYEPGGVKVDIYATNYIPLRDIIIPFTWNGDITLLFDSVSTEGLRTDYFETVEYLNIDNYVKKRAAIRMQSSSAGAQPMLAPGDGAILSLHFSGSGAQNGVDPIEFISYASFEPKFVAQQGSYYPDLIGGAITASTGSGCCVGTIGNIDCSPDDAVSLGDLTVMIDHLFVSFDPLCCEAEANLDGVEGVSLGDLTVLIDHLFVSFEELPSCP